MIVNEVNTTTLYTHASLEEVKHNLHLLEDETEDDEMICGLIEAANDFARGVTDHFFAHTQIDYMVLDVESLSELKFKVAPLDKVVSIEIYNEELEDYEELASDEYYVEKKGGSFVLHFLSPIDTEKMKICIRVGYDIGKIPMIAKRAIILKASDMYDVERSDYSEKTINNDIFAGYLREFLNKRF